MVSRPDSDSESDDTTGDLASMGRAIRKGVDSTRQRTWPRLTHAIIKTLFMANSHVPADVLQASVFCEYSFEDKTKEAKAREYRRQEQ